MEKSDKWCGYFSLIISVLVCVESNRMGLGSIFQPGPGFVPFWTGLVFGVLSATLVLLVSKKKAPKTNREGGSMSRMGWLKVIFIAVAMLLYAIVLEKAGFVITTFILMIILLKIEKLRWSMVLVVALATALGSYLVFEVWLQSQLPKGFLGI
jgi:putative tricarboxylic transport membrane protein